MKKIHIFFLLAIFSFPFILSFPSFAQNKKIIRVAITQDANKAYISVRGKFEIKPLAAEESLYKGKRLHSSLVIPQNTGIKIGNMDFKVCCIRIVPEKDGTIYINDRIFRGEINIIRNQNLKLTIVNSLDIEDYVRGVLYHEVSHIWPLEAIKAQAVATRTYALYQANLNKDKDFDVTSDIYSQVYGGKTSEKYRTNVAVNRTKGEVLFYQGEVLPAFFSAACAGHTEDASNLWNTNLAPLKGVVCNFCKNSPHYRWRSNFRLKYLEEKLRKEDFDVADIKNIEVTKRNSTGRVEALKITCRDASSVNISAKNFRRIIGPNELRSNNYEVVMKGYYVDFVGHGWGHGVGLCQWGAKAMAEKGNNYIQILKFYYPNSEIKTIEK